MNQFRESLKVVTKPLSSEGKNTDIKDNYYIMYDEKRKKIGIIDSSLEKTQDNWLRGVSVFVINQDGNLILEQRSENTKLEPGKIDLCSGHRDRNERGTETVNRELEEELGIQPKRIVKLKRIGSEVPLTFKANRKFFIQFYASLIDKNNKEMSLQTEEVQKVMEVPLEEGFELIRQGKTKFPYEGKEKEFEHIFKLVRKFIEKQKENFERE